MAVNLTDRIKTLLKADFSVIKILLSQLYSGYLLDNGWFQSYKNKTSVDKNGNPIPWITYPFIDFISERLNKNIDIFEFGSGNSTFFYATKVKSLITVEHDKQWFDKISKIIPENVEIIFREGDTDGNYCRCIKDTHNKFDIIIDDALDRVNCIYSSLESLSEKGVIILDDSERKEYKDGVDFLIKSNFKKLDFWGIAPGILFRKCTSVFYKKNNCLEI
ncbi:MAG: hypothetical protein WB779_07590 [Ignavibacteriaceae bacterium]